MHHALHVLDASVSFTRSLSLFLQSFFIILIMRMNFIFQTCLRGTTGENHANHVARSQTDPSLLNSAPQFYIEPRSLTLKLTCCLFLLVLLKVGACRRHRLCCGCQQQTVPPEYWFLASDHQPKASTNKYRVSRTGILFIKTTLATYESLVWLLSL